MRAFNPLNAFSLEEASAAMKQPGAMAMAGGGDLLGALKDDIFEEYPRLVVNLKTIPGLDKVEVRHGFLCLGALCMLGDLSRNETVKAVAPMVADAAAQCASPALRGPAVTHFAHAHCLRQRCAVLHTLALKTGRQNESHRKKRIQRTASAAETAWQPARGDDKHFNDMKQKIHLHLCSFSTKFSTESST